MKNVDENYFYKSLMSAKRSSYLDTNPLVCYFHFVLFIPIYVDCFKNVLIGVVVFIKQTKNCILLAISRESDLTPRLSYNKGRYCLSMSHI